MPEKSRPFVFWGLVVLALTFGAQIEAGSGSGFDFWPTLARNYAILAVFAGTILTQQVISKRTERDGLAWIIAFAAFFVVGAITDGVIS